MTTTIVGLNNVFVYGTLKSGHYNHYLLEGSDFIGEAVSIDKYILFDKGGYPFAQPYMYGLPVMGEVYAVDEVTLESLDQLEGHPRWYKRVEKDFWLKDNKSCKAWIYEIVNKYPECPTIVNGLGDRIYQWS